MTDKRELADKFWELLHSHSSYSRNATQKDVALLDFHRLQCTFFEEQLCINTIAYLALSKKNMSSALHFIIFSQG